MATQFDTTIVERKMTLTLPVPETDDAPVVLRAEVSLFGEHVVNLSVVLHVGTLFQTRPAWLYEYLDSDEWYAIARDAARAALRHYKVKVKDLSTEGVRLVTMDRATHAAARANELADYHRATGTGRSAA